MNELWTSPAFFIPAAITMVAAFYSYFHLPMKMRRAYRQSLLTLARAVETKDAGAEGHGERVAKYVVAVAREMRLPSREVTKMEYAAFLQDIGNVRVPAAILNKTGRLTAEEFGILKTHTLMGAEMVGGIKFLSSIAPIIRHHHEAWDGSGYPDGLSGEGIPLGARILAVCTAYDSMVHSRSYRRGMSEEQAVREIRAGAGKRFDPKIVDVFLRTLKRMYGDEGES